VLNLIRNENMKLYKRPRNRLILLAIFVLVSFITFMVWNFSAADFGKTTMWNLVSDVFVNAKLFLYIFSVIVAGDIVASEFTTGPLKCWRFVQFHAHVFC
jgi:ABC-2 type transport system permease protein